MSANNTPVARTSDLLKGPPQGDHTVLITMSTAPSGQVCWWVSEGLSKSLSVGLKDELVAQLDDFLGAFVRQRG